MIIATIEEPALIDCILTYLGLSAQPPLRVVLKLRRIDSTRGDVGVKKSSRDRSVHRTPYD